MRERSKQLHEAGEVTSDYSLPEFISEDGDPSREGAQFPSKTCKP
jgi:hypothetical protein